MLATIISANDDGLIHMVTNETLSLKKKSMIATMAASTIRSIRPFRESPAMNWPLPGISADASAATNGIALTEVVVGVVIDRDGR